MTIPLARSFKTAVDVRFPEADEMPQNMQEPYKKIQENLERMADRVKDLEKVDITTVTDFRQNILQVEAAALGFDDAEAISDFMNALNG